MYEVNPTITLEMLTSIWGRVSGKPTFWEETDGETFDRFIRNLVDSDCFVLFDYGMARISPGWSNSIGEVHAVFWGKKVVRSIPEIREALQKAVSPLPYFEFACIVPPHLHGLRKLVRDIGFRIRGEVPNYYRLRNGYHKAVQYGILKTEVLHGW